MAFRNNDQYYFNNIRDKLAMFISTVKSDNSVNLQSLNIHAEQFYVEFLNKLFDWNLRNANEIRKNAKGIDLIDQNNKIIAQVSSRATHEKVQSSLDKIDQAKYDGYHFVFIAITERIPNYRKPFRVPNSIEFDWKCDMFSAMQIQDRILYTEIDKKKELSALFDKFFSDKTEDDIKTINPPAHWRLDKPEYSLEIVFCIDGTQSMNPVIEMVKKQSLNIYKDIRFQMEKKGKTIGQIRVRIILFRDYAFDQDDAMVTTRFFELPDETGLFVDSMKNMEAKGGGDDPESGLEALGLAIHSDWSSYKGNKRQIIFVWSDADAHPLGIGMDNNIYPDGMAKSFLELTDWWNDGTFIDQNSKRLVLFTPTTTWWSEIINEWTNVLVVPSANNKSVFDYESAIGGIVNSI